MALPPSALLAVTYVAEAPGSRPRLTIGAKGVQRKERSPCVVAQTPTTAWPFPLTPFAPALVP